MKKRYVVFGGSGSIGSSVTNRLLETESIVHATSFSTPLSEILPRDGLRVSRVDVTNRDDVRILGNKEIRRGCIDGVVYAVGHCPPSGATTALMTPLSRLHHEAYAQDVGRHQLGVLNVFQTMLRVVRNGGAFVFISSAVTRFKGTEVPGRLQFHAHAGVIAAEDWLVDAMRRDPIVIERGIKIHRIAPAAVDTPFHSGCGLKSLRLIAVVSVVAKVLEALSADAVVDEMMV